MIAYLSFQTTSLVRPTRLFGTLGKEVIKSHIQIWSNANANKNDVTKSVMPEGEKI